MIIKRQNKKREDVSNSKTEITSQPIQAEKIEEQEEEIDFFDLDNIDFTQRQERRRGDRRRGYRRVDDRNLISRAQEEAENIKDSAAKEGYKEGVEKAQEDIQLLRDGIKNFYGAKQEILDKVSPSIIEISLDIAKKIIKKEVEIDTSIVFSSIKEIIQGLPKDEKRITIKVSSEIIEEVKPEINKLKENIGLDMKISVISEEGLDKGSCIVTTSDGIVDATIDTQIEIITEALKGL